MNPIALKPLADTGLDLPEIGFGTWRYRGGPELIRQAIDLGAWLIDTAESYGTEEVVGGAIKGIRDKVFVATKTHHHHRDDVLKCAEASLLRLGIETIDLYQLHWPSVVAPLEETMGAMETLVAQGKVRFIGVSNFMVSDLRRAQAVMRKHKIVSNQVRHSLVERTIEPQLLRYCQEQGITVIAFSPLAEDYRSLLARDRNDVLGQVAKEVGKTRAQVALNWVIAKQGVITIPKTESLEHLRENCGSSGWRLSEEQRERLRKEVPYRRRGWIELRLRRIVKGTLQRMRDRKG